jgi:hypothetical protein
MPGGYQQFLLSGIVDAARLFVKDDGWHDLEALRGGIAEHGIAGSADCSVARDRPQS